MNYTEKLTNVLKAYYGSNGPSMNLPKLINDYNDWRDWQQKYNGEVLPAVPTNSFPTSAVEIITKELEKRGFIVRS